MLLPTNFLIGVGVVGAILMATRFASLGRKLIVLSIVLLAVCEFSPLGKLVLYPLESRFPSWDPTRGAPDGIVVLGGSIDPDLSSAHGEAVFGAAADRIIAAAALAHRYPNSRIIFSGGSANLISKDAKEADYAGAAFESLGVSPERLTMERQARNTLENAEFSKALAAPEKQRSMAAGDVGLPYAPIRRGISKGWVCHRALSGRLADRRARGPSQGLVFIGSWAGKRRHWHPRVDRPCRLLDIRQNKRIHARTGPSIDKTAFRRARAVVDQCSLEINSSRAQRLFPRPQRCRVVGVWRTFTSPRNPLPSLATY